MCACRTLLPSAVTPSCSLARKTRYVGAIRVRGMIWHLLFYWGAVRRLWTALILCKMKLLVGIRVLISCRDKAKLLLLVHHSLTAACLVLHF